MCLRNSWLRHHPRKKKKSSAGKQKQPFVKLILSVPLSDEVFIRSNNQGDVQLGFVGFPPHLWLRSPQVTTDCSLGTKLLYLCTLDPD